MKALLTTVSLLLAQTAYAACPPLLDFRVKDIDGQTQDLCAYAGKVVLVVNTASECGFTPQYKGLQALHARYKSQGLVVLGFPANDFFGQESGSNEEIKDFCQTHYAVDFPLFSKISVKKGRAQALHEALYKATGERPGWNFHKYLIDRSGTKAVSFGTRVAPESAEFENTIKRLLKADVTASGTRQ